jgi:hydroxymethylpyrimidine pyrophosphatase-like HAD family hydrolase
MLKLADWPLADRQRITGVFTDIDDTLTTDGAITADALQALGKLKAAGLQVIPITGRPVGWSTPFALAWPVDAIVAENGAVALFTHRAEPPALSLVGRGASSSAGTDPSTGSGRTVLAKFYQQDEATRRANYSRMQQVALRITREVPGAGLSQDSAGRETDIAIDHSEFVHLSPQQITQAVAIMQSEGMNATVSSIHINGWYGAHNKLEGARWIARELLARDLDAEIARWVYVGDSPNDELMFEAFPHSVGVANIRRFEVELSHLPRYITEGERGAGFAEVAAALLQARRL